MNNEEQSNSNDQGDNKKVDLRGEEINLVNEPESVMQQPVKNLIDNDQRHVKVEHQATDNYNKTEKENPSKIIAEEQIKAERQVKNVESAKEENVQPNQVQPVFFTDNEFSTIIFQTQKGHNARDVVDMDKKVATQEQIDMLADNNKLNPAHKIKILTNMNVKAPAKVLIDSVGRDLVKENKINPQMQQRVIQNLKNMGKGLNIE